MRNVCDGGTQSHPVVFPCYLFCRLQLAELLLSAGADAALQDSSGSTAKALAPPGWDFLA